MLSREPAALGNWGNERQAQFVVCEITILIIEAMDVEQLVQGGAIAYWH